MPIVFFIVLLVALIAFIWRMLAVKELAIDAAKKHCRTMDVQFLDGTVTQCGLRLKRFNTGRVVLMQTFQFEFTPTGERRYLGWTTFIGRRMASMELQPHVIPDQQDRLH